MVSTCLLTPGPLGSTLKRSGDLLGASVTPGSEVGSGHLAPHLAWLPAVVAAVIQISFSWY